jgi:asparagine synthase (glutamine-hydrolysing)
MCGVIGIYSFKSDVSEDALIEMSKAITHRGPDNGSVKVFGNVGLGHRRLSIIDLSNEANQPMSCGDDRFTIVYNGEVYNFLEIKNKLKQQGVKFYNSSDTEVILNSFKAYGSDCFAMFNGMFALAIYDAIENELILARDQFGIKPLYIYSDTNLFIFASEKKAILQSKEIDLNLNSQALLEYTWFGNPLGDNTFYDKIIEIEPGTFLKVNKKGLEKKKFFRINDIKEREISEEDAIKKIRSLLEESVKRHLISDVPVGVFLSGGIDSSAITAYAAKHYRGKLKTYSVGFDYDKGINELALASKVAAKFETDHTEIQITGEDLIEVIEDLVISHDEPFGDAANIPLFLLTKKLKGKVKVVLQGDGGDEFFGGYSRYKNSQKISWWKSLRCLTSLIKKSKIENTAALRLQRFIDAITENELYQRNALLLTMESKFANPIRIFNKSKKDELNKLDPFKRYKEVYSDYDDKMDATQALFFTDTQIILKDTFFEKVDKSTMANSIEVRVPFVDKELTEFMLSLRGNLKVKNGVQKYLLKKALEDTVPHEILYGKKKGFSVPYSYWLKTSLKGYFLEQINSEKVKGYIDRKEVLRLYHLHEKGKGNYGFLLWKTLIFSVWLNKTNIR